MPKWLLSSTMHKGWGNYYLLCVAVHLSNATRMPSAFGTKVHGVQWVLVKMSAPSLFLSPSVGPGEQNTMLAMSISHSGSCHSNRTQCHIRDINKIQRMAQVASSHSSFQPTQRHIVMPDSPWGSELQYSLFVLGQLTPDSTKQGQQRVMLREVLIKTPAFLMRCCEGLVEGIEKCCQTSLFLVADTSEIFVPHFSL